MKKITIFLLCSAFFFTPTGVWSQKTKKVLVIGIDGCRSDALMAADASFIKGLFSTSTYALDGQTTTPTMSAVGWSNMNTGVWPTKHNIMNSSNDFSPNNFAQWPDFFTYLENSNPSLVTAAFCNWGPLNTYVFHADNEVTTATYSDAITTSNAISYIANNNPDAILVDLDEVDHTGHANSFDPANANYLAAIKTADQQTNSIITAIKNRPNYANEDWLFIITTDHGGTGSSHGGGSVGERTVWAVVNGPGATPNYQKQTTSTTTYSIAKSVSFNGSTDYMKASNKAAFNFGTSQDFTLECKVKLNSLSGDPVIMGNKNWNSGANKGFVISFSGTSWKFNISDGTNRQDVSGCDINDGKWHHISVSVDRDKYAAIYQDGVFIGSTIVSNVGDISSGLEFALGQDGTTTYGSKFNGSLSDVRVWNKALSPEVIKQWYNQAVVTSHPDYSFLNALWKLDEGSGTTLNDLKGANSMIYGGSSITWNSLISTQTPTFENAMKMVDIAVTALDHFGLHPANLDGTTLLQPVSNNPVANFTSDITSVNKNNYVAFTSTSINNPTTYSWTFNGGTPASSISQNPVVKYLTPGVYPVSLTVSNAYGSDTKTVAGYITVTDIAVSNKALDFDGTADFVSVPDAAVLNMGTNSFTLEAWVSPVAQAIDPVIVANKDWNSGNNVGYALYQEDGMYKFNISDGVTRINGYTDIVIATATPNKWDHLAVVVQRGGTITTYLNGILQNTTDVSSMTGSVNTTFGLKMGADALNNYTWIGKLDEVRLWNSVRTAQQVAADMAAEIQNPQAETNLVAYYKFNQTAGSIVTEAKNGLYGTMSSNMNGADWVASGAFLETIPPTVPTGLAASSIKTTSVTLSWNASTDNVGVTGYKIYKGTVLVATINSLSYTVTGLTRRTSYTFYVSAIDAAGNESGKASIAVTTPSKAPAANYQEELTDKLYVENKSIYIYNSSTSKRNYQVYTVNGQLIKSGFANPGENKIALSINGVVILKYNNGEINTVTRLIVK